MTTKRAAITVLAFEETKALEVRVGVGPEAGNNVISGTVTSTIFHWSKKYTPGATKSIEGTAKGEVTLYNKTGQSQALRKTTRLLTDTGILFRLSNYVAIPANGQVVAEVYADKPGKESDIPPSRFTIPGLSADLQKDIYAVSAKAMQGGGTMVGVVTPEELTAAEQDFKEKIKGAFITEKFPANAASADQHLVSVIDSKVVADQKAGAEVREFTLTGTSTLAVISYNQTELNQLVQKMISEKIDVATEKVLTTDAPLRVTLTATTLPKGMAELSVNKPIVVTLNEDSEQLKETNFTGKTKEEIQQYVKTLPHVTGAEVNFTPGWLVHTAPTIPGKIKVTVRMVK